MPITNPEDIRYCNETVRPLAEHVRSLKANIDSAMSRWHAGGVGARFVAALGETVEDGRESEGVSRLTGNDVVGLVVQLEAIQTLLNQSGVPAVVAKPCVRDLIA